MAVFNSLGSNYDFKFSLKALTLSDNPKYKTELIELLEKKYQGKTVLTYKGRDALLLALKLLNLPEGSFIAINGFTCFAVYEAVKNAKLNIEYLDIEKDSLDFSAKTLNDKIKKNSKIKAVIIQNTLGFDCQIAEIAKVCKENKLFLIEDLAHSIGLVYPDGQEAGTVGDFTALSFSQDKVIDGVSGGALIVRNGKYQKRTLKTAPLASTTKERLYPFITFVIRKTYPLGLGKVLHFILKNLGILKNPMDTLGSGVVNSLPGLNAKLASLQFDSLEESLKHRHKIYGVYKKSLNPKLLFFKEEQGSNLVSLRFPILVDERKDLIQYLKSNNIYVSDIWYDCPIAPKKYLHLSNYSEGQCPNSEEISKKIVNLPTHTNVSEEDAYQISQLINKWYEQK